MNLFGGALFIFCLLCGTTSAVFGDLDRPYRPVYLNVYSFYDQQVKCQQIMDQQSSYGTPNLASQRIDDYRTGSVDCSAFLAKFGLRVMEGVQLPIWHSAVKLGRWQPDDLAENSRFEYLLSESQLVERDEEDAFVETGYSLTGTARDLSRRNDPSEHSLNIYEWTDRDPNEFHFTVDGWTRKMRMRGIQPRLQRFQCWSATTDSELLALLQSASSPKGENYDLFYLNCHDGAKWLVEQLCQHTPKHLPFRGFVAPRRLNRAARCGRFASCGLMKDSNAKMQIGLDNGEVASLADSDDQ